MSLTTSLEPLQRLNIDSGARDTRSETSAVTTTRGGHWHEEIVARGIMQNFYDANRDRLAEVLMTVRRSGVEISAGVPVDRGRDREEP